MKRFLKRFQKTLLILSLALASVPVVACGGNKPPIVVVADATTKAEKVGLTILKAAQSAHYIVNPTTHQPLVSTGQLDRVAIYCDKLGRLGTDLSNGLKSYKAAKAAGTDSTAFASNIKALVAEAVQALQDIGKEVPKGTLSTIDEAITDGLAVYATIRAAQL
jgi:hypothetical protein